MKKSMLGIALVLALIALFLTGGFVLLRGTPDYYRQSRLSSEQRAQAAARAESKLSQMQNLAADSHGAEVRASVGATRPAVAPDSRTFSFTDDELNALFNKWADLNGWKDMFASVVQDPMIVLQDGRVIFAGKVTLKNMDTIVSIHFVPSIDVDGDLDLKLESILGGKLPLPKETVISPMREKLGRQLGRVLPNMQNKAQITPEGAANEDAVKALLGKMLLHTLNDQPSAAVVFLPLFSKGNRMAPFKVRDVSVENNALTFSVISMTPPERTALIEQIKRPVTVAETSPRD